MVLRKSILYTVYKLNSVEYELKSSYVIRSASEPAKFDRVDLHRSSLWLNSQPKWRLFG